MARLGPLIAAPVLWAVHFTGVYGLASLACSEAPGWTLAPAPLIFWGTALLTLATLLLAAAGIVRHVRTLREAPPATERGDFTARVGVLLYGLASVAMAWVALPGLLLPGCG